MMVKVTLFFYEIFIFPMRMFFQYFFYIFLIFNTVFVQANQQQTRQSFELAEKYLLQGNKAKFDELYRDLHYYSLQPYLTQKKLIKTMSLSSSKAIDEFLRVYQGSPLDWPLRKKWLQYLDKKKQGGLFLKFFKTSNNVELTCKFHLYQLKAGLAKSIVLPKVSKLWVVGKSQPRACDDLFEIWEKAGYRTTKVIWQRIIKAADGGKHTLLPYLVKLLPAQDRSVAQLWRKVRVDPSYVRKLSRFPNKSTMETQIITYALKRYIWRDVDGALKTYQQAIKQYPFHTHQINEINQKFALVLASKGHKDARVWLNKLSNQQFTSDLIQWRITEILRSENWYQIKQDLLEFPTEQQKKLQWRYWYGRSLTLTGELEKGIKALTLVAKERHYYGFLAAGYLKKPVNLKHSPIQVTDQEKYQILAEPAAKRAFEFFHMGRFLQARSEWNFWMKKLNKREQLVAAKVASEKGWFDRAIFTLSRVGYLDDVGLRFPMAFEQAILQYASQHQINPAWAFAITRRESSFMSDAHSSAGASGLMQIMPGTAKQLAKKKVSRATLYTANKNINLGTKYLKQLSDRYQGNQILATASYNAGPHRVKKWLRERPELPADIWIETIPYKETREYVKSVMAYQQIYQINLGQDAILFNDLVDMVIR
jgi:soluble lytic murein transglycosylase